MRGTTLSLTNARQLRIARIGWCGLAVFVAAWFAVGTVLRYGDLQQPCAPAIEVCMQTMRLRPVNLQGLASPAAALHFYAIFYTIEQVSIRLLFGTIAALIFWRRPHGWFPFVISLWLLVAFPPPFAEQAAVQRWPLLAAPLVILEILRRVGLVLFLYTFPNGHFVPGWLRWPAVVNMGVSTVGASLAVTNMITVVPNSLALFELVFTVQFYGIALYGQVYRYRNVSTATERQQAKWVVLGIALSVCFILVTRIGVGFNWSPDDPISATFYLSIVGLALAVIPFPLTLGIAILRYRLFDIVVIINRALLYGTLTVVVASVYAFVVGGLSAFVGVQSLTPMASIIAAATIAMLFQPMRARVQRGVDRLMYGRREEPYIVMADLGRQIESTVASDSVFQTIVTAIAQALKLPYVAIITGDGSMESEYRATASDGSSASDPTLIRLPLTYQHQHVGTLLLARRAGEARFSSVDQKLLIDLARQASIAVHAARMTADVQRSREHTVTAREEERRRLRRDLHDGLGPQLASQTLTLDAIAKMMRTDPDQAEALLRSVREQTQQAVGAIRELVYGLRPPALDDVGLDNAIRQVADRMPRVQGAPRIVVQTLDDVPALPAAVEVAAYRIAQEALTNVVKHARATECQVRLCLDEPEPDARGTRTALRPRFFRLEIADNGVGIAADRLPGVGLQSMRERAEELGGRVSIEHNTDRGTCICAMLPLGNGRRR